MVAGGDGTIGFVSRALIDTDHTLGILSLGTYNNFAKGLGLPASLAGAIRVMKTGVLHKITVGKVGGTSFLEAAAIGMFGAAIELGEAIKDRHFGEFGQKLGVVTGAKPFRYEITGDLQGHGMAMSLVFANTPSSARRCRSPTQIRWTPISNLRSMPEPRATTSSAGC